MSKASSQPNSNLSPAARVTHAIEAALASGVRPWAKPWRDAGEFVPITLPRRATGEAYRGINVIALWAASDAAGFTSPYWFTFKQALAQGAAVRKGERGAFVVFYREIEDDDDEKRKRYILRGYTVFNADQVDGLDDPFKAQSPISPVGTDDLFAARFTRVPARVRLGGARAFYAPSSDHVQLPHREAFVDAAQFYATYAHELGHWTSHPTRLDRNFGQKRFGDFGYALEELVAELCSAFVGAVIGLPADHIESHASYIDHWLNIVRDDPSAFLTAAAKAQAAADYLLRLMGEVAASEAPGSRQGSPDEEL